MSKKNKTKIDEPAAQKNISFAFPTRSKCPRCGSTDTTAYSTKGNVQYRRCLRAICRWTYHVFGQEI